MLITRFKFPSVMARKESRQDTHKKKMMNVNMMC